MGLLFRQMGFVGLATRDTEPNHKATTEEDKRMDDDEDKHGQCMENGKEDEAMIDQDDKDDINGEVNDDKDTDEKDMTKTQMMKDKEDDVETGKINDGGRQGKERMVQKNKSRNANERWNQLVVRCVQSKQKSCSKTT